MSEETGIPAEEPTQTETQTEATGDSGANYHDRIRGESEFAVEEVQKKDRYINELHTARDKLKGIEEYVDAAGGVNELIRLAQDGYKIQSNPQVAQAVQQVLTGPTTPEPREEEEEIFDPEVKAINSKFEDTIDKQNEIIQDLQSRLNRTEALSLKGSLTENMEKALSVFADDSELLAEATGEIKKAVEGLEKAATSGDRSAASQLQQIAGGSGSKTLRMMTIDIYDKYVAKKLETLPNRPNGETMLSKATDERNTSRSALPGDTITVKTGAKVTSQTVDEVMAKVTAKYGKDPATFWN